MIIRIMAPSASFKGLAYNMAKIGKGQGELIKVANVELLEGLAKVKPADYIHYFKMIASLNKQIKQPQFHAVIGANRKLHDKGALREIAIRWLKEMGYQKQPYIIFYHWDTQSNHVHIVSLRLSKTGKKIDSNFERIRAVQHLNRIIGLDERLQLQNDLNLALNYRFCAEAHMIILMQHLGYIVKMGGDKLELIRYGRKQGEISRAQVQMLCKEYVPDPETQGRLKSAFEKYSAVYYTALSPKLLPLSGGRFRVSKAYTSAFAEFMKKEMGITLAFQVDRSGHPYDYLLIDHNSKAVFPGCNIMSFQDLIGRKGFQSYEAVEAGNFYPGAPLHTISQQDIMVSTADRLEPEQQSSHHTVSISIASDVNDEKVYGRFRKKIRSRTI